VQYDVVLSFEDVPNINGVQAGIDGVDGYKDIFVYSAMVDNLAVNDIYRVFFRVYTDE
jgi:hypothetical protein